MYFIEKEEGLIGKEIAYTNFAQFADAILIVTKDKGIFVCSQDEEQIYIYRENRAKNYVLKDDYLREELNNLGIITNEEVSEYLEEVILKWEKDKALRKKQDEENELKNYLRLKEKYEK